MEKDFWYEDSCHGNVEDRQIQFIESSIGVTLPKKYIDLVKVCDGGCPRREDFKYFNEYRKSYSISGIGGFLFLNNSKYSDFLEEFKSPPEFFPQGLIAFADTGGGDLICFDYRQGKDNLDPPIVYWSHGGEEGKDVSFIAKNFEEFIGMLYEPED
jgi:hypothetical protein